MCVSKHTYATEDKVKMMLQKKERKIWNQHALWKYLIRDDLDGLWQKCNKFMSHRYISSGLNGIFSYDTYSKK